MESRRTTQRRIHRALLAVGNERAVDYLAKAAQVALWKLDQAGELAETIKEQLPDLSADALLDNAEPPRGYIEMLAEAFAIPTAEALRQ